MDYNLKITTDNSDLETTQGLMNDIASSASEVGTEIDNSFNAGPIEEVAGAANDGASAMSNLSTQTQSATAAQNQYDKAASKGSRTNRRFGISLLTNALRMAGFSKEARIAGAALNVLNRVSLKSISSGIVNLSKGVKDFAVNGVKSLVSGFTNIAVSGAKSFKALVLSARTASIGIRGALVATGIGALVVAVGVLISNFDELKESGVLSFKNILKLGLAPFTGGLSLIPGITEGIGDSFTSVFGDIQEVINSAIGSIRNFASAITGGLIDSAEKAAQRAAQAVREADREAIASSTNRYAEVAKLRDSNFDTEIAQLKASGATQKEIDELSIKRNKEKAAFLGLQLKSQQKLVAALEQEKKELDLIGGKDEAQNQARQKASQDAIKAQTEVNNLQREIAQTATANAAITKAAADREAEAIDKANAARAETLRLEKDRLKIVEDLTNKLLRTETERLKAIATAEKEARDKQIQESVKDAKLRDELLLANEKNLQQQITNIDVQAANERVKLEQQILLNQDDLKIAKIKEETEARKAQVRELFDDEEKANQLILGLEKRQADEIQAIRQKTIDNQIKEESKIIKAKLKEQESLLDLERKTALNSIDLERQKGETQQQLDERTNQERERIELEYQRAIIESKLKFNTQLNEIDRQRLEQDLIRINNQIGEAAKVVEEKSNPFDFQGQLDSALSSLGLDESAISAVKQQAAQAAQFIVDQFSRAADARLQAAQELVEFRNKNIERLNQQLANEIEVNKLGLASNIERVQKEIAEEKQLRDEALAQQEAAAKQKQLIETAQQSASLLTAIANVYASLAGIPGIGIGLATAAAAALLAAFAVSKAKVAEVTQLREGGLIDGPSHERGGIKYYNRDGSKIKELEGNEYVMPVKQTMKNLPFLEKMRQGAFDNIDLMDRMTNPNLVASLHKKSDQYFHFTNSNDYSSLERAININSDKQVRALEDIQDKPVIYRDNKGNLIKSIYKNGNLITTKIR